MTKGADTKVGTEGLWYNFQFNKSDTERFFDNLTYGLPTILNKVMKVEDISILPRRAVDSRKIQKWENQQQCPLPQDLVDFYQKTNGLKMTWGYKVNKGATLKLGLLKIVPFQQLKLLRNIKEDENFDLTNCLNMVADGDVPKFDENFKIIKLERTRDCTTVCLIYSLTRKSHSIWLLDRSYQWHFIADSFTKYYQAMIQSAGLPEWQLLKTQLSMSPWAEYLLSTFSRKISEILTEPRRSLRVDSTENSNYFKVAFLSPTEIHVDTKQHRGPYFPSMSNNKRADFGVNEADKENYKSKKGDVDSSQKQEISQEDSIEDNSWVGSLEDVFDSTEKSKDN